MRKQNLSDGEQEDLLTDLSKASHEPKGMFSAKESYPILEKQLAASKTKRIPWFKYVAAASVVFILSLSSYWFYQDNKSHTITLFTAGQIETIDLPDGTKVTLSRYSSLQYPSKFTDKERKVSLSGEGFFDVAKDQEYPFVVSAGDIRIKVLGTQFNVQAYTKDEYIQTILVEGSVAISNVRNEQTAVMEPNQLAVFYKKTASLHKETVNNALEAVAWKDGKLLFNDKTLLQITEDLSNYFNVPINVSDSALKDYKLTARFEQNESIEDILNVLQTAAGFTWEKNEDTITINPEN